MCIKKPPHANNLYENPSHTNNSPSHTNNMYKKPSHKNHRILTICMKNHYTNNFMIFCSR